VALWISEAGRCHFGVGFPPSHRCYGAKRIHRTCFWGGDAFAPQLKVKTKEGKEVPVQQFLQGAYLDMWEVVVKSLTDLDCVVGFEVGPS